MAETAEIPALSIHTTHATPDSIAYVTSDNPHALAIADRLPLKYVVNEQPIVDSALSSTDGLISVEAGKPNSMLEPRRQRGSFGPFCGAPALLAG